MDIAITNFAKRQYNEDFTGTYVTPSMVEEIIELAQSPYLIHAGYAEFCKIITIANKTAKGFRFPSIISNVISRKEARAQGGVFHTAYEARTSEELPVLVEWVSGVEKKAAQFVHIIVYSKQQLEEEGENITAQWGIVSINGSTQSKLEPMKPITAMRNALGVNEGGSGVALDRRAYKTSVAFWSDYIAIR